MAADWTRKHHTRPQQIHIHIHLATRISIIINATADRLSVKAR